MLTRGGVEFKCNHVNLRGTQSGTFNGTAFSTSTVALEADYTTPTCSGPLGSESHYDFVTNHCGYHFSGTASQTASLILTCANGGGVTITPTVIGSSVCTITVPPQEMNGHVVYSNITEDNKGAVTAEITATNIVTTRTGSSACGPASDAAMTYRG